MVVAACASMFALVAPGGQAQQPYRPLLVRYTASTMALPMRSGFFSIALIGSQAWAGSAAPHLSTTPHWDRAGFVQWFYPQGQSLLGQADALLGGGMTLALSELPTVGEIVRAGAYGISDPFRAQIGPPLRDGDSLEADNFRLRVIDSKKERPLIDKGSPTTKASISQSPTVSIMASMSRFQDFRSTTASGCALRPSGSLSATPMRRSPTSNPTSRFISRGSGCPVALLSLFSGSTGFFSFAPAP